MRAALISEPGGPEAIHIVDIDVPEPDSGQIAIDVELAGVNFVDVMQRRGVYASDGPFVCGIEVAGRVRALGAGVEGFAVGDPVVAFTGSGGYAEVALAQARHAVALTGELAAVPPREAVTAPTVGVTAVALVEELARVGDGDVVLVHGAAGAMGSVLAALARSRGAARVIGTVGTEAKVAVARGFGYDDVLLRGELAERLGQVAPDGVDVVLDPVGGAVFRASLEALRPLGRLVRYGNASGDEDEPLPTLPLVYANRTLSGFSMRMLAARRPDAYRRLLVRALELIKAGVIPVSISEQRSLDDAVAVHRRLEAGETTGKLLLVPRMGDVISDR